jgi:hypothetical protein
MWQNLDLRFLLFIAFYQVFFPPIFHFFDLAFYCLFSFFDLISLSPFVFSFFFTFVLYLFFFAYVVSSLAYPNLLGNKMFGCCCCCYKEHICCDIVSKYQLYLIRKKRNINYILFFLLVYTIHIRIVTNVIPELSPHKPLRKLV